MFREYVCECCKGEFVEERSEEEALLEKEDLYPGLEKEEEAIVCEYCFIKIMDYNEPVQFRYLKYIKRH